MKRKSITILICLVLILCSYTLTPKANEISTTTPIGSSSPKNIVDLSKLPSKSQNIKYDYKMAQELLNIINTEREKIGLKAFDNDYALQKVADFRNYDMISNNYMSHTKAENNTSEREILYNLIGYNHYGSGENIAAMMYTSAQDFFDCWCSDEPHKNLLFSPIFNKAGISIAYGYNNCYIATLDLAATNINNVSKDTITGTSSNISNNVSSTSDQTETYDNNNLYALTLFAIALIFMVKNKKQISS